MFVTPSCLIHWY